MTQNYEHYRMFSFSACHRWLMGGKSYPVRSNSFPGLEFSLGKKKGFDPFNL